MQLPPNSSMPCPLGSSRASSFFLHVKCKENAKHSSPGMTFPNAASLETQSCGFNFDAPAVLSHPIPWHEVSLCKLPERLNLYRRNIGLQDRFHVPLHTRSIPG